MGTWEVFWTVDCSDASYCCTVLLLYFWKITWWFLSLCIGEEVWALLASPSLLWNRACGFSRDLSWQAVLLSALVVAILTIARGREMLLLQLESSDKITLSSFISDGFCSTKPRADVGDLNCILCWERKRKSFWESQANYVKTLQFHYRTLS